MEVGPGVPRVVADLCATVEISSHEEVVILGQLHEGQRLHLPFIPVGMGTVFRIRVVPVEVHTVGIVADGSVYRTVPSEIGAVGIGQRVDPYVQVVHQGVDIRVAAIIG